MFGDNFEFDLMNPDEMIEKFKNLYVGVQEEVSANEDKIKSLEKEKERIEELKKLWEDAKNYYRDTQYEAKLNSFFGSDYEKKLLNDSLAERQKFADEYAKICAQIKDVENQITKLETEESSSSSSGSGSSGGSGSGGGVGDLGNKEDDNSNTKKKSIAKYQWADNDTTLLSKLKDELKSLTDQMKTDSSESLKIAKENVNNLITEFEKLGTTGIVTPEFKEQLKELMDSGNDYLNGVEPIARAIETRTDLANRYVVTSVDIVDASDENLNNFASNVERTTKAVQVVPSAAEETIDAGKQQVEESSKKLLDYAQNAGLVKEGAKSLGDVAKTALTDADATIEKATTDITTLNEAMGNLEIAKQGIQNAANNSVQGVDTIVTDTSGKMTSISNEISTLLSNIDSLNIAIGKLGSTLAALDQVTLSKITAIFGEGDKESGGLINAINSVIDRIINEEDGLIMQIEAVNQASLETIMNSFAGEDEDTLSLIKAIRNVSSEIYDEENENSLYMRIVALEEAAPPKVNAIVSHFETFRLKVVDCEREIDKLSRKINELSDVTITVRYSVKDKHATGTALTGYASGTATPSGSSYARGTGNWGLPQDEKKAAVGELGNEILLRDSQWYLIDKPQLMDLKKGDIIFNHAQTESILKNGKNSRINEFARLGEPVAEKLHKKGNSFADGTLPKGWRKVDVFEDLRNSGAVYDMDKFDSAVMKMKTDPESIKTMMYNPNNMPDWNKFVSSGQTVNTTNNNQQTSVTYEFNGDLSFPNIKSGDDVQRFIHELQHVSAGFLQRANRH